MATEDMNVCLSGGGIRSACFSLGALEVMCGRRKKDSNGNESEKLCPLRLSCVSGGGFTGASFYRHMMIQQEKIQQKKIQQEKIQQEKNQEKKGKGKGKEGDESEPNTCYDNTGDKACKHLRSMMVNNASYLTRYAAEAPEKKGMRTLVAGVIVLFATSALPIVWYSIGFSAAVNDCIYFILNDTIMDIIERGSFTPIPWLILLIFLSPLLLYVLTFILGGFFLPVCTSIRDCFSCCCDYCGRSRCDCCRECTPSRWIVPFLSGLHSLLLLPLSALFIVTLIHIIFACFWGICLRDSSTFFSTVSSICLFSITAGTYVYNMGSGLSSVHSKRWKLIATVIITLSVGALLVLSLSSRFLLWKVVFQSCKDEENKWSRTRHNREEYGMLWITLDFPWIELMIIVLLIISLIVAKTTSELLHSYYRVCLVNSFFPRIKDKESQGKPPRDPILEKEEVPDVTLLLNTCLNNWKSGCAVLTINPAKKMYYYREQEDSKYVTQSRDIPDVRTLGGYMALSGAAVSVDMGEWNKSAQSTLRLLLLFYQINLGLWLRNPIHVKEDKKGKRCRSCWPKFFEKIGLCQIIVAISLPSASFVSRVLCDTKLHWGCIVGWFFIVILYLFTVFVRVPLGKPKQGNLGQKMYDVKCWFTKGIRCVKNYLSREWLYRGIALALQLLDETFFYMFVSDGGHVDNLGVVGMLQTLTKEGKIKPGERTRTDIYCFDGSEDAKLKYEDLTNAFAMIKKLYPGTTIETEHPIPQDKDGNNDLTLSVFKLKLRLEDGNADSTSKVYVWYAKACRGCKDQSLALWLAERKSSKFPHHPTTQQSMTPEMARNYISLGSLTAEKILEVRKKLDKTGVDNADWVDVDSANVPINQSIENQKKALASYLEVVIISTEKGEVSGSGNG